MVRRQYLQPVENIQKSQGRMFESNPVSDDGQIQNSSD
jgi:hypothetical protein